MKLAVVTSFPEDPAAPHGGVEAVSVNLVRALAKRDDLEVHVVTTGRECTSRTKTMWEGATLHRLEWAGGSVLRHATGPGRRQIQAFLLSLKPDVIHAHDTYGLTVQGLAIPRVFTIHGFIYADTRLADGRFARLRSAIWKRIEMAGWADQPRIVSISPYVRERLHGVARGVIHDIDNPISDRCFEIPRREMPGRIFSAAVITPRKNTLGLVEAFKRLVQSGCDAQLRLAGSAGAKGSGYLDRVRSYIRENGLEERVILLGRINQDAIADELSKAAVFTLVSFEENSPMGIEEAMAAGVPVVTSNCCGMPYMVRDGESGFLVNPSDPADIALWLRKILDDNALRMKMGETSRQIARERFHPDVVARRTHEVYLRAAGEHRNGTGAMQRQESAE